MLVDGRQRRARRILEKFSDPTTEPEATSSGKAALGAWQGTLTAANTRRPRKK